MKSARNAVAKLREQFEKHGKAILLEAVAPLFEKHPEVKSVQWRQYTPYFNDGDACTFSVSRYWAYNAEDEDPPFPYDSPIRRAADKTMDKLMASFDDDDLEAMFGDHTRVIVTPKTVKVEEYCHD